LGILQCLRGQLKLVTIDGHMLHQGCWSTSSCCERAHLRQCIMRSTLLPVLLVGNLSQSAAACCHEHGKQRCALVAMPSPNRRPAPQHALSLLVCRVHPTTGKRFYYSPQLMTHFMNSTIVKIHCLMSQLMCTPYFFRRCMGLRHCALSSPGPPRS
jgi:hypothetical protein